MTTTTKTPSQEANTGTEKPKNYPSHKAFLVDNFQKDGEQKADWTEIGAAWPHKDGKSLDILLKTVPLNGRIVISHSVPKNPDNP